MRQRIAIAIALACRPKLLIADEPTTALDVTVQAGILRLLDRLRRENDLAVILITHDLGVMSAIADRVSIFYAGRVVESGSRGGRPAPAAPPVHARTARRVAASRAAREPAARGDPRLPAEPREHPARMRVPPAVRVRARRLSAPRSRARGERTDARSRVPSTRSPQNDRARAHGRRRRLRAARRRPRACRGGSEHQRRARSDRRPRRRVGLRQVDARQGSGGARPPRRRDPSSSRAARSCRSLAGAGRASSPASSSCSRTRYASLNPRRKVGSQLADALDDARPRPRRGTAGSRSGAAASSSGCRRPQRIGFRTSSRAASGSASRSPAPSPPTRR